MTDQEAIAALQAENARLVALLEAHGIAWRAPRAVAVEERNKCEFERING